jgi:hypothetical protein
MILLCKSIVTKSKEVKPGSNLTESLLRKAGPQKGIFRQWWYFPPVVFFFPQFPLFILVLLLTIYRSLIPSSFLFKKRSFASDDISPCRLFSPSFSFLSSSFSPFIVVSFPPHSCSTFWSTQLCVQGLTRLRIDEAVHPYPVRLDDVAFLYTQR